MLADGVNMPARNVTRSWLNYEPRVFDELPQILLGERLRYLFDRGKRR